MAKRIRRFVISAPVSVTGARNLSWSVDNRHSVDFSRADDEAVGDPVDMGGGPVTVNFEMLAYNADMVTDYIEELVCTWSEVTYATGQESDVTQYTATFEDGYLKAAGDVPTENPGAIPITGEFKNVTIAVVP